MDMLMTQIIDMISVVAYTVIMLYVHDLLIMRRVTKLVTKLEAKVTRASNLSIEAVARAEVNEVFVEIMKEMIERKK